MTSTPHRVRLAVTAITALHFGLHAARPAGAQTPGVSSLGSNSRGYVSVDQVFPGTCGKGASFESGQTMVFAPGNASLSCAGAGWSGQSVMNSAARSLSASAAVSATNLSARGITSLARALYVDSWFIDPTGMVPTSVTFTFDLSGTSSSSGLVNALAGSSSSFYFSFDTDNAFVPKARGPGQITLTYSITSAMIGRYLPMQTELFLFAGLNNALGTVSPFSGTQVTDFSNTLVMSRVSFLQRQADGSDQDVTSQVNLTSLSGTDYRAPFTTVPEPGALLLLSVGLASGAILRRAVRRRSTPTSSAP